MNQPLYHTDYEEILHSGTAFNITSLRIEGILLAGLEGFSDPNDLRGLSGEGTDYLTPRK